MGDFFSITLLIHSAPLIWVLTLLFNHTKLFVSLRTIYYLFLLAGKTFLHVISLFTPLLNADLYLVIFLKNYFTLLKAINVFQHSVTLSMLFFFFLNSRVIIAMHFYMYLFVHYLYFNEIYFLCGIFWILVQKLPTVLIVIAWNIVDTQ